MTPEFWAIIGVGVSLAVVALASHQMLSKRFDDVNRRFDDVNRRTDDTNKRIDALSSDVKQLTSRVTELEKGQAAIGGLLNGLREALFERTRS